MARFSQPPNFDFFHQSPTALESKPIFAADDEMNVLDGKILESSAIHDPRRSSFDHSAADDFSRRESVWSDMAHHNPESQSRHPSQLSTPLFEPISNPFVRLDTTQTPAFPAPSQSHQQAQSQQLQQRQQQQQQQQTPQTPSQQSQQSWGPLSVSSGSCTPTPVFEHFPHDYDANPFNGGPVGAVQPLSYPSMPFRPGSTFPPQSSLPMSPQASQGWMGAATPGDAADGQTKSARNPSFRSGSTLHMRRDGIRKKNARFDIPAERTLGTIDFLISQTNDEDEIKELKQQKRLLRNRQAALDSRQRKKVHTEQLEEDKRRSSALIKDLQDSLQEMKLRETEMMREKNEMLERSQQLHQYLEQLHQEKDELIRAHTLETGELRKKINILREHAEKLEMNANATSAFRNEFTTEYDNMTIDHAPWDEDYLVNDFSLGAETLARTPTPTPENPLLTASKRLAKAGDKQQSSQAEHPFSWNAFYMCLLFGAFIASNSSSMSTPAIPPLSEEYRAESANVLRAVLASAGPSDPAVTQTRPVISFTSQPAVLPTTISGSEMARMTSGVAPGVSSLDDFHHNLVAPTRDQENEQAFAMTAEQYKALTTLDESEGGAKPAPSNLQQAYAAMRNNAMQNRPNLKGSQDVYSRSLLWDRVPDKVLRDFRKMVKECGVGPVKNEDGGGTMCP